MTLDEIIRINKWINFLIAGFVFVLVQFYFNSDNYKDDLLMKYSFQVSRYELLQKTNESENLDHLKNVIKQTNIEIGKIKTENEKRFFDKKFMISMMLFCLGIVYYSKNKYFITFGKYIFKNEKILFGIRRTFIA